MLSDDLLFRIVEEYGTPVYVYNQDTIEQKYADLDTSISFSPKRIYYACKANSNLALLKIFEELGSFIDVVSPGEIFLALKAGFEPERLLFTGNNLTQSEMEYAINNNILLTVDSLSQLKTYGKLNPHSDVSVRINPNLGAGHHAYVVTGGIDSKFGIYFLKIYDILDIARKYQLNIIGLHMHIGSGILEYRILLKGIESLLECASHFKNLDFIDIGGGIGISHTQKSFDLPLYGQAVTDMFQQWVKGHGEITLAVEPGRFLVAESGVLLTTVTSIKENFENTFVGVDTGFNHFMRPILYNAQHKITVLGSHFKNEKKVSICGNICENGDILAKNIVLPHVEEGNILIIHNTGAYGVSMASQYNSRVLPAEVLVHNGYPVLIRRRGRYEDFLLHQCGDCNEP
ncbi:MAG: diaminopimelate decarboxylase [Candidatus Methanofastidiosia archaeon]|jgi:diaminopimelate decarboxylase